MAPEVSTTLICISITYVHAFFFSFDHDKRLLLRRKVAGARYDVMITGDH